MRRIITVLACLIVLTLAVFLLLRTPEPTYPPPAASRPGEAEETGSAEWDPVAEFAGMTPSWRLGPLPAGAEDAASTNQSAGLSHAIPRELVLGFFSANDRAGFIRVAESNGVAVVDTLDVGNAVRIRYADDEQLLRLLEEGPLAVNQSPNFVAVLPRPLQVGGPGASDPAFRTLQEQWREMLGLHDASMSRGQGTLVAVLDTGVGEHSALAAEGVTRVELDGFEDPGGDHTYHGTAVASIIAGTEGVVGVSPGAALLSIPVLTSAGVGDTFTIAKGIVEAVNRGATVINLCLGTQGDCFVLEEAVQYALDRGVAVVASAGNDGADTVRYPAQYDGVVAVGAVDSLGKPLSFSNRGEAIDLAAPGLGVPAAGQDDALIEFSGTSASTPFVSGAVAALMAEGLSAEEALSALTEYADDVAEPGPDTATGEGMINLQRARERETAGIIDAAVGLPYIKSVNEEKGYLEIVAYVQNRGTEVLGGVTLQVDIDGVSNAGQWSNVSVGQTMAAEFRTDLQAARARGAITVSVRAVANGAMDTRPENDAVKVVLGVGE